MNSVKADRLAGQMYLSKYNLMMCNELQDVKLWKGVVTGASLRKWWLGSDLKDE